MSILEKILYCILFVVCFCLINSAGFDICDLKFYIPNDDAKKTIIGHLIQLFSIVILAITLITTVKNNSIFRIEKFYETLMLNINDARFNKKEGINAYIEFSQYYKNQFVVSKPIRRQNNPERDD